MENLDPRAYEYKVTFTGKKGTQTRIVSYEEYLNIKRFENSPKSKLKIDNVEKMPRRNLTDKWFN